MELRSSFPGRLGTFWREFGNDRDGITYWMMYNSILGTDDIGMHTMYRRDQELSWKCT